ncbi:hypothetical protein BJV77DRAFT_971738 [Russula vinacea]|nr:hypothetical protein BJV77DRAFT_971738 [Russula vinacea]
MRFTSLTALFFALFSLFCTLAYAAPVDPQGAVNKRCSMGECKDAVPAPPSSGSTIDPGTILELISNLLNYLPPSSAQPPAAAYALTSTSVPTTQPTGTHQPTPTFRWFTEIAIPSPSPSGV